MIRRFSQIALCSALLLSLYCLSAPNAYAAEVSFRGGSGGSGVVVRNAMGDDVSPMNGANCTMDELMNCIPQLGINNTDSLTELGITNASQLTNLRFTLLYTGTYTGTTDLDITLNLRFGQNCADIVIDNINGCTEGELLVFSGTLTANQSSMVLTLSDSATPNASSILANLFNANPNLRIISLNLRSSAGESNRSLTDLRFGATVTNAQAAAIPEPATIVLLSTGLGGIAAGVRRRKKKIQAGN